MLPGNGTFATKVEFNSEPIRLTLDASKAIATLLTNGGDALDYMEVIGKGQKVTKPAAPWVAVPTTAGTGAEATRNAVIGHPGKRFKASIRSLSQTKRNASRP